MIRRRAKREGERYCCEGCSLPAAIENNKNYSKEASVNVSSLDDEATTAENGCSLQSLKWCGCLVDSNAVHLEIGVNHDALSSSLSSVAVVVLDGEKRQC